ncbi:MFS transporter [Hyunsoonleella sp. SJ7]|uniref:MFS transporter n=1 Tax=Hyunsoonleella aquatilis TaxID=2762758 RepID=A0A923KKU0_9FLAO|nr:MFS transporter [Hyunsoonleella aquatilis]MBC3758842.1 MFS transporter [Hyunsoonleella aquatilis]
MKKQLELIKPKTFPFFYGYVILLFGSIGVLFSIPGQTVGVSLFTDPVKDALHLSRNEFSNAYMLGTLLSAFFVTKAGILFDRLGARAVGFLAAICLGGTLLLLSQSKGIVEGIQSLLNTDTSLVAVAVLTLLFFMLRFSGQGVLTMTSRNMVMLWFDKNRGKINSISSITVSLGFSSSPLLMDYLIDNHGWQGSWQILALSLFCFCLLVLLFFKNAPEAYGLIPDGKNIIPKKVNTSPEGLSKAYTLTEAKQTRAFWIIGLALAFNSFFITGVTFHVVSIFESQGYTKAEAIAIFIPISIIGITISTVANILSDYVAHKIFIYLMLCGGLLAVSGLWFLGDTVGVYALIGGLGIMSGLFAVLNAVTWPKYYGRVHLGAITGKAMSFLVIASAIAPSMFSASFTYFGDYKYVALLAFVFLVGLIVAGLGVKRPE